MLNLTYPISLKFKRRIQILQYAKWSCLLVLPVCIWIALSIDPFLKMVFSFLSFALGIALNVWETSQRRQFVRESILPGFIVGKLQEKYPHLSASDADLVMRGLRQFFITYLRSGKQFVAMPSQVVDAAWHEFILHTRGYQSWCDIAFGKLLHHSPAEVLGASEHRNFGLRRAWYWACKEESINPTKAYRLPLLFALDKKLNIPNGFIYAPDCKIIDEQSRADTHCATDFGDLGRGNGSSGCGGGGCGGSGGDGGGDGGGGCGGGCGS